MLSLIDRSAAFFPGYRDYCREAYESHVTYFVPSDPARLDDGWFERTKSWYDRKELGLIPDQPRGFHYWAADGNEFIGEFQLRTELTERVMTDMGSVGYAVRVSRQGRGYGTELLRRGLALAREKHGLNRVLLCINEENAVSIHVCEKLGGVLMDTIPAENSAEGPHLRRRYWIDL
jgi:predicted acetyltransferase